VTDKLQNNIKNLVEEFNFNGEKKFKIIVLFGLLGDFDSFEYAINLKSFIDNHKDKNLDIFAIAIGNKNGKENILEFNNDIGGRYSIWSIISQPVYAGTNGEFFSFNEGGQLTEAVRRRPYTVVLFDEVEKAHPDVFNLLLQLLEDGRLTDSKGRTVDFKNTLLIMTSNIGSKVIEKGGGGLGFEFSGDSVEDSQYNRIKSLVNEELKQYFRPEFLNRLDEIIVFRQLTKNEVKEIAEIMLQEVFVRLQDKGSKLNVTDAFKERLVDEGYNPSYGARPLRRAVMRFLEERLAEEVLSGRIKDGDNALVDIDDNKKVTINISSEESSQELASANF